MTPATPSPHVTLSIVSHGQGSLIRVLLEDLRAGADLSFEIILTLNIREDESFLDDFSDLPLRVIRNATAKGFGANHNAALAQATGRWLAIVNPDIRVRPLRLAPLAETLSNASVGACGPVVLSSAGKTEDSARQFPTWWRLVRRAFLRIRRPDYEWHKSPIDVDWLAGMFVMFRREAFADVAGFDERFFMYFEDADICRRLQKRGWKVRLDPRSSVVHDAQRASHRSLRHLRWHVSSAVRYLTGL